MKQKKYEVYMGIVNYVGEVYDNEKVAEFYSKQRAIDYVNECNAKTDGHYRYGFIER